MNSLESFADPRPFTKSISQLNKTSEDTLAQLKSLFETEKSRLENKLREEKDNLKTQLQKFKGFWNSIMSHFHKRICYDRDDNYKIVSEDLHKHVLCRRTDK